MSGGLEGIDQIDLAARDERPAKDPKKGRRGKDKAGKADNGDTDDGAHVGPHDKAPVGDDTVPGTSGAARDDTAYDIVNHLLWHKALIDERDGGERIEEYLDIVRQSEKGEHVSMQDPFNKSIALAFELVLAEHMNPWKIDLGTFSRLYLKRAQEQEIELVTAGRIILMAWTVLRLQSDAMVTLAEEMAARYEEPEPEMLDWDDIGDWDYDDEDFEYTQRIKHAPVAPLDEKVRRTGAQRKVTLMELVDAFEEVRREVEERQELMAMREETKQKLRAQSDDDVAGMVHREDPEEEQRQVWDRIQTFNGAPIPLKQLHERDVDSLVAAFNSILFLAADRKVEIWQDEFPYGDIYVKNLARDGTPEDPEATQADGDDGRPPMAMEEHANRDPEADAEEAAA